MVRPNETSPLKVSVLQLGGEVRTFTIEQGTTVAELLTMAGLSGHTASVDGVTVEQNAILEDGDEVFIGQNIKGAM